MFHLCAYTTAIGAVANTDVPALSDDVLQIQNSHFILSNPLKCLLAASMSPTWIDGQIVSPTVRQINPTYIRPGILTALPGANPNMAFQYDGGMSLNAFEEIQILGSANPGTTERYTTLLWLQDIFTQPPQGAVYVCRWTSTTAAVANAWTSITFSMTNVLPSGVYTMVQSEHFSTNAQAHRWIFSNQMFRPGHISQANATSRQPYQSQVNWLGAMGQFRSNDLPRLQVLCNAADASHTGFMYLVRTGNLVP